MADEKDKKKTYLRITSKKNGFRRAGIEHPDTPVYHEVEKLTKEQIKMLKNEPMLIVDEVDKLPKEKAGKGK